MKYRGFEILIMNYAFPDGIAKTSIGNMIKFYLEGKNLHISIRGPFNHISGV